MSSNVKNTIFKIVFFSFLIGIIVSFFEINPKELLANFGETVQDIFAVVADIIEWAVQYILLGAVVVVPIWLIFFLFGKLKK